MEYCYKSIIKRFLVFPLPDHRVTESPMLTNTGCSGSHQAVQEPIMQPLQTRVFDIISGLPKIIWQARKK